MAGFRQPEFTRSQLVLFTRSLDEVVPATHPVRLVEEMLGSPHFLAAWDKMATAYSQKEGRPPFHPRALGSLWLYGMMNRIRSSRQLETACHNRVDFMWLMQDQRPDHGTIALFVKRHRPELKELLRATLKIALSAELMHAKQLAIDGSKIEANANNDSMKKRPALEASLANLDSSIAKLEAEWDGNEAKEEGIPEAPWTPPASQAKEKASLERKREKVKAAIDAMERREKEHERNNARQAPAPVASVTDPDARQMRDKEGRSKPNYTTQLAIDTESGLITAAAVTDQCWDGGGLLPMIEESQNNTQVKPTEVLADSAYNTGPALAALEEKKVEAYMPDSGKTRPSSPERSEAIEAARNQRELTEEQKKLLIDNRTRRLSSEAFWFDSERDVYVCPAGQTLRRVRTHPDVNVCGVSQRTQYQASREACGGCALKTICLGPNSRSRMVTRDGYEEKREALRRRMRTPAGLATYKRRTVAERAYSWLKTVGSMRKFLCRGFDGVRAEFTLACAAANLRILVARRRTEVLPASG